MKTPPSRPAQVGEIPPRVHPSPHASSRAMSGPSVSTTSAARRRVSRSRREGEGGDGRRKTPDRRIQLRRSHLSVFHDDFEGFCGGVGGDALRLRTGWDARNVAVGEVENGINRLKNSRRREWLEFTKKDVRVEFTESLHAFAQSRTPRRSTRLDCSVRVDSGPYSYQVELMRGDGGLVRCFPYLGKTLVDDRARPDSASSRRAQVDPTGGARRPSQSTRVPLWTWPSQPVALDLRVGRRGAVRARVGVAVLPVVDSAEMSAEGSLGVGVTGVPKSESTARTTSTTSTTSMRRRKTTRERRSSFSSPATG